MHPKLSTIAAWIMDEWINQLDLRYLDHESGLFAVESISNLEVQFEDGKSPASNCIFYALTQDYPQNHLHRLSPDDHHILIDGGPADYFLFYPDGYATRQTLGRDLSAGQKLIVVAPGGCQKAIRLHSEADFLLVGSVVTPAWSPERVTFGGGQAFIDQFSGVADWATSEFLKELIGPNWIDES